MMKSRLDIAFGAILNQEIITRRRSNDDDANMPRVFPKQKDIKKQPMFTCLQTKEYCY